MPLQRNKSLRKYKRIQIQKGNLYYSDNTYPNVVVGYLLTFNTFLSDIFQMYFKQINSKITIISYYENKYITTALFVWLTDWNHRLPMKWRLFFFNSRSREKRKEAILYI